jgi:hypothetical protein
MPAVPIAPDATLPQLDSLAARHLDTLIGASAPKVLTARQTVVTIQPGIIPTYYDFSGPSPGTVVGIVLGSVIGFLLIVWLLYSLTQINSGGGNAVIAGEEEIVVRRPARRGSQAQSGRSRRSTRTEVREYSRSPRRSAVIVEERRRAAAPPPRVRSIVVEDRRVPGDDMVEVIEEHDEYRTRRGPRRSGGSYR